MLDLPDFKRGDTFSLGCLKKDSGGTPENLSAVTISAQVRTPADELLATAVCAKVDQSANPGEFSVTVDPSVTSLWDLGKVLIDVQFSVGGAVTSTDTMRFKIVRDITHA